MPTIFDQLNKNLQILEQELIDLYEDLNLTGNPTLQSDYKLAIKVNLRKMEFIKGQIAEHTGLSRPFYVTVVTGRAERVKKLMGEKLYTLLVPPNHDIKDLGNWIPFDESINGGGTVRSILSSLKFDGYAIIDSYIDSAVYQTSVIKFMSSPNNNIAIIDLLSLDNENELITRLFNHQDIAGLIIPDNVNLHVDVKQFVENLKTVLSNFATNNIYYLVFNNMINRPILKTQIEWLMKRNQPITNSIQLSGGDDRVRKLNTAL